MGQQRLRVQRLTAVVENRWAFSKGLRKAVISHRVAVLSINLPSMFGDGL